ncbi:BspA family leucine-rich repeat surface protein [Mycoplasma mycoides]|uniref:BspA family leucine-rich repeat surface protein n=1 Tax=Mycoplasma mycoides TaxID=2102 RepID=UPI002240A70F|nr:BspA family leucine-rich repeat surface protein [Mycoplasma mycoides]QVK05059.1 BspA family leucine-rich repeat surface protein [Mycoplasma mycoides subsp. capri]
MKKLLTILTSCSFGFLITTSIILVNKNNGENNIISYNAQRKKVNHDFEDKRTRKKLTKVGYYYKGSQVIIDQIPPTVEVIAADLPEEITSLRNAFFGNKQNVRWEKPWDTKNITDMSAMFYDAIWLNDASIKNWDTSKVTDMSRMFHKAKNFNQDLSNWNVSNVKNFQSMFEEANEFNNGGKPLEWGEKLKSANNMSKMFKNALEFKQNLNNWLMKTEVNKNDFGLDETLHPKWYVKPQIQPPTFPSSSETTSDELARSDNSNSSISIDNNVVPDNEIVDIQPNVPIDHPSVDLTPKVEPEIPSGKPQNPKLDREIEKNETVIENNNEQPKKESETSIEDKIESLKNNENLHKIPAKPNTIIKSNSPNAVVITGAVLGTFTVLGIAGGTGYYYRKNLKNFYLNSANKTKNLYFKSKNKIKDKLSKIKSKK